jgi:hypothetical protein
MSDDRSDDGSEQDTFDDAEDADPFGDEVFDGPSDEPEDRFDGPDADEGDDPFAALGEGVGGGADPDRDGGPRSDDGPSSNDAREAGSGPDPEPGAPADDPFAELDADAGDATPDEDPFESMGTGDVGEEDVWEALDEGTSVGADATEFDAEAAGDLGDAARSTDRATGAAAGDERVVDKRSYCQRCPHFSAPPETSCSHEGTEIVESVDFSRFRVRNCPMIDAEDPAFDGE